MNGKNNEKEDAEKIPSVSHEPLDFSVILIRIIECSLLVSTMELHLDVPSEEKKTIEKVVIQYILTQNIPFSDIVDKVLDSLSKALKRRREEATKVDKEMKYQAIEKYEIFVSKEEKKEIFHRKSTELYTKIRIGLLMSMNDDIKRKIQSEIEDITNKIID